MEPTADTTSTQPAVTTYAASAGLFPEKKSNKAMLAYALATLVILIIIGVAGFLLLTERGKKLIGLNNQNTINLGSQDAETAKAQINQTETEINSTNETIDADSSYEKLDTELEFGIQ